MRTKRVRRTRKTKRIKKTRVRKTKRTKKTRVRRHGKRTKKVSKTKRKIKRKRKQRGGVTRLEAIWAGVRTPVEVVSGIVGILLLALAGYKGYRRFNKRDHLEDKVADLMKVWKNIIDDKCKGQRDSCGVEVNDELVGGVEHELRELCKGQYVSKEDANPLVDECGAWQ